MEISGRVANLVLSACLSNVQGNTNLGEFGRTGVYVNK